MQAREQIERLIFLYAEKLDLGDLDAVANLFSHGRIMVHGQPHGMDGAEGVKQALAAFTIFYDNEGKQVDPLKDKGRPFTRHITSNVFFESLMENTAEVHSCFSVLQGLPGQEIKTVISGRYQDKFERQDQEWFFKERLEFIDLIGDLSNHLKANPF